MHDPAIVQGLIADLNQTLERARDERLRLVRLMKDCETRIGGGGGAPDAAPADEMRRVLEKVSAVDAALTVRFERLQEAETTLDQRATKIERMETGMRGLSQQFARDMQRARDFDADVMDARGRIEREAAEVLDSLRGQLRGEFDAICGEVTQTVEQMQDVEQALVDKRCDAQRVVQQAAGMIEGQVARAAEEIEDHGRHVIESVHQQLGERIDQATGVLNDRVDAAQQQLHDKLTVIDADADRLIEPVRAAIDSALERGGRAADELAASLTGRLDGELTDRLERHRDALAAREAQLCRELVERFDGHAAALRERLGRALRDAEGEALQRASEAVEGRVAAVVADARGRADDVTKSMQARLDACFDQVACEAENAAEKLRQMLADTGFEADRHAAALLERVEAQLRSKVVEAAGLVEPFEQRARAIADRQRASLDEMADRFREAADRHVLHANEEVATAASAIQRKAGEVVAQFERDTHAVVEPLDRQLESRLAALRERGPRAVDEAMSQAHERLKDVRASASAMVKMVEEQLADRLEAMGPRAQARLASAQHALDERIDQAHAQIEQRLAPLRSQTLDEIDRLAECSVQVRQLAGSLRGPFAAAHADHSTIADPERMLDALDKLARKLGYRVLPAAEMRVAQTPDAADAQAA